MKAFLGVCPLIAMILGCSHQSVKNSQRQIAGGTFDMKIQVEANPTTTKSFSASLVKNPRVSKYLNSRHYSTLATETLDNGRFRNKIYDYTTDRLLVVEGPIPDSENSVVKVDLIKKSLKQMPPTQQEFLEAKMFLENTREFGPAIQSGKYMVYQAMPGILDANILKQETSLSPAERVVTLGLWPTSSDGYEAEIVGVSLSSQKLVRFPQNNAPPTSRVPDPSLRTQPPQRHYKNHSQSAEAGVCGVVNNGQFGPNRGSPGSVTIKIADGQGGELWSFNVTRPAASSGTWGSGIELQDVYFKGHMVLKRAHVPVFNVQYETTLCGPYRDWAYQEDDFKVGNDQQPDGVLLAPGILKANSAPQTVLESGSDQGNFTGVAVYTDETGATSLVSEMAAGWYRYISKWTFKPDGTIHPQFGFGAVQNACVCFKHHHHVYWRFDFNIDGNGDNVTEVLEDDAWRTVTEETSFNRDSSHQQWRISSRSSGGTQAGYTIVPQANDGTALGDSFAKGDVWVLKQRPEELDDSSVNGEVNVFGFLAPQAPIAIDAFVNGESVLNTNDVIWYGAHFTHDVAAEPDEGETTDHILGPVLKPINWFENSPPQTAPPRHRAVGH